MANQESIQQQEEAREGTFCWKIERFLEQKGEMKSTCFKLGREMCFLCILERSNTCSSCSQRYQVCVYSSETCHNTLFSALTFYKESLIDRNGLEFLTNEGSLKQNKFAIFCFHKAYLETHSEELLPEGTLTIALSWYGSNDEDTRLIQNSTSDVDSPKFLETLSKDFQSFYESQTDTDCVLRVGDAQISAHRQVLSARSTVFAAMFRHDTSENRSGVVDILDVDAAVFSDVIHYIYSGQIRGMSSDTAAAMYFVADKYGLFELRDVSLDVLMRNLTIENVSDAAIVAHRHGESKLEEKIVQFIDEKLEELDKSDDWIQFSKDEPLLSLKLLRSAYLASKKRQNNLIAADLEFFNAHNQFALNDPEFAKLPLRDYLNQYTTFFPQQDTIYKDLIATTLNEGENVQVIPPAQGQAPGITPEAMAAMQEACKTFNDAELKKVAKLTCEIEECLEYFKYCYPYIYHIFVGGDDEYKLPGDTVKLLEIKNNLNAKIVLKVGYIAKPLPFEHEARIFPLDVENSPFIKEHKAKLEHYFSFKSDNTILVLNNAKLMEEEFCNDWCDFNVKILRSRIHKDSTPESKKEIEAEIMTFERMRAKYAPRFSRNNVIPPSNKSTVLPPLCTPSTSKELQKAMQAVTIGEEDDVCTIVRENCFSISDVKELPAYKEFSGICELHAAQFKDTLKLEQFKEGVQLLTKDAACSEKIKKLADNDLFSDFSKSVQEKKAGFCRHWSLLLHSDFTAVLPCSCFKKKEDEKDPKIIPHFCSKMAHCEIGSKCVFNCGFPIMQDSCGKECVLKHKKLAPIFKKLILAKNPAWIYNPTMTPEEVRQRIPAFLHPPKTYWEKVKSVGTWISDMFKAIWNYIKKVWNWFKKGVCAVFNFICDYKYIFMGIFGVIGGFFAIKYREDLPDLPGKIGTAVSDRYTAGVEYVKSYWPKPAPNAPEGAGSINDHIEIGDSIKGSKFKADGQIIPSGDSKQARRLARVEMASKFLKAPESVGVARFESPHFETVMDIVAKNTIWLHGNKHDESGNPIKGHYSFVRAVGLGGHFVLTVLHAWEIFAMLEITHVTFAITDRVFTVKLCDIVSSPFDDSQLILLRMPVTTPMFRNIIKFFATEGDHSLRTPNSGVLLAIDSRVAPYSVDIGLQTSAIEIVAEGATPMFRSGLYKYNLHGNGCCGNLLLAPSLNRPIIGMHVAGMPAIKVGYSEPLVFEDFCTIFDVKTPEPLVLPPLFDSDSSVIDIDTLVLPLGSVGDKHSHHNPVKTAILQSPICGYMGPFSAPAPLDNHDPRIPPGSSPLIAGISKHGILTDNFPPQAVVRAKYRLFSHLITKCKPIRSVRPLKLTDSQAVVGDNQLPFCDPLRWNSSEGYPYTRLKQMHKIKDSTKKWLFDLDSGPNGYIFKGYKEPLKSFLYTKRLGRAAGRCQPTIFTDCLKDARIPLEKVSIPGKTRIFSMSPIDYTIDFRIYFYDFIAAYQVQRFSNFNMIGINYWKEWDTLAHTLKQHPFICTGDYSNFGPGLNEIVADACMDVVCDWYTHFDKDESVEDKRTRRCLVGELINANHLCKDLIYQVVAGIPSGSPITVVLNSLVNTMYLMIAFDLMSYSWPISLRSFDLFNTDLCLYTYGDDFIFSVSDRLKDFFNAFTISEFFKKYNIKLTDAFKGENVTPYTSLEEAQFLKGGFKFWAGKYWYALDEKSIYDMPNFVNSPYNTISLTVQNADQALLYAHGHGKTFFENLRNKLNVAFAKIGQVYHGRRFIEITTLKEDSDFYLTAFDSFHKITANP